jgi:xylulokinase
MASPSRALAGSRAGRILARAGSALTSQAVGPKLLWLQRHKRELWSAAARWFSTSSFVVEKLTGQYVLDHHTASQCDPMYDMVTQDWAPGWADMLSPGVPLPELAWSDQVVGNVTARAAAYTGLPQGTPVLAGTVDAWAEAHSVGVRDERDLMIMYGSTLFLIGVDHHTDTHPGLWRTAGLSPGTRTLSAGMATSGLLTQWIAETTGRPLADLASSAEQVPPGADGLAILPYFAGERSPLFDPGARGAVLGLTLAHTPAHLMRAAYEAVAMGVRHNLEAFDSVTQEGTRWRAIAVGGGATGDLWPQIVTDVSGLPQVIPEQIIGACYGDALLAATAVGMVPKDTCWMNPARSIHPRLELADLYNERYSIYRDLYAVTRPLIDRL